MKHIVIDLEMNALDKKFKDEKIICGREIIQIGAVLLDDQYQEIGYFNTLVKPQYNERIESLVARIIRYRLGYRAGNAVARTATVILEVISRIEL